MNLLKLIPSHDISGFESIFGYNRGDLDYKLLHMLNYGNIVLHDSDQKVGGTANRWWNMQAPLDAAGNKDRKSVV